MNKRFPVVPVIAGAALLVGLIGVAVLSFRDDPSAPKPPPAATDSAEKTDADAGVLRKDVAITPERFRKQGTSYAVKVIGNLHGRANNEDWGVQAVMNVNYIVTLRYEETVLVSEPEKLIIERHFLESRHRLFTSVEDFDLSEDMKNLETFVDYLAIIEPRVGQAKTAAEKIGVKLKEKLLAESARLKFDWSPVLEKVGKDPAKAIRTLTSKLEGRKVKLLWTPGGGVQILGGADGLPERERRLLERASLLADGALFPNKNKRRGERWMVSAEHFTDFLDVGIDGALRGKVALRRGADEDIEGQKCARLEMVGGTIDVVSEDASRSARGTLSPTGVLHFDLQNDLIRASKLSGKSKASFDSKNHLLFKSKFKGTPSFTVGYEATLKKP